MGQVLANASAAPDNDLYRLAERLPADRRPALRIDCGQQDFLYEGNLAFHAHLEKLGYSHVFAMPAGEHNWPYWNRQLPEALAFAAACMKLGKV